MSSWDACQRSTCTGSGTALGLESLVGEGAEKAAEVKLSTSAVRKVRDKKESSSIVGSPGWSQVSQHRASMPFISDSC
jgi:hypothetical protein